MKDCLSSGFNGGPDIPCQKVHAKHSTWQASNGSSERRPSIHTTVIDGTGNCRENTEQGTKSSQFSNLQTNINKQTYKTRMTKIASCCLNKGLLYWLILYTSP